MNNAYNDIWKWLDSTSIKYKNYEIKNVIFAYKCSQLRVLSNRIKHNSVREILSILKWKIILYLLKKKRNIKNIIYKQNLNYNYDLVNKNIYIYNLSTKDFRNFFHIANLAKNDKRSLVFTIRKDVYEYFKKENIAVVLFNIDNPWRAIEHLKIHIPITLGRRHPLYSLDIFSLVLLSKAASLIDLLEILTKNRGLPKTVITLQDFFPFDSIFATYFSNKVPTVTLQHGKVNFSKEIENKIWKYLISDWMIVFGINQAEVLKLLGVNPKKIKILGTAKYDLRYTKICNRQINKGNRILIGIQKSAFFKSNCEFVINFLKVLLKSEKEFLLSIRFHPAITSSDCREFMQKLKRKSISSKVILENSKIKDPLEDVSKSDVVLISKSTLGMEAMLIGKPIIEYLSKREESSNFFDYRNFSLHAFTGEEARDLIIKLLENDNFYKKITEKQNRFINYEILLPPAIPRILNFINSLSEDNENTGV